MGRTKGSTRKNIKWLEKALLDLINHGLRSSCIAESFNLHRSTIHRHVQSIKPELEETNKDKWRKIRHAQYVQNVRDFHYIRTRGFRACQDLQRERAINHLEKMKKEWREAEVLLEEYANKWKNMQQCDRL